MTHTPRAIKGLCGRSRTTGGQNHTGDRRSPGIVRRPVGRQGARNRARVRSARPRHARVRRSDRRPGDTAASPGRFAAGRLPAGGIPHRGVLGFLKASYCKKSRQLQIMPMGRRYSLGRMVNFLRRCSNALFLQVVIHGSGVQFVLAAQRVCAG